MMKSNASRLIAAAVLLLFCSSSPLLAEASAPSLELLVLGSGGPGAAGRAASSYLVYVDGVARVLVDAGPGSFARLGESRASLSKTDLVLLTHLHIDHVGELPGLFKARAVSGSGPIVFNVWGPGGSPGHGQDAYFPSTQQLMQLLFGRKGAFAYLSDFAAPLSIRAHDIAAPAANGIPEQLFKEGDLLVRAVAGHHGDAPAVIYRIDHGGKSVTFSGDIDAAGLSALRGIAKDTDLLVFNSVVLDPPDSRAILYTLHTPPLAIGQLAKAAGVRALLLSHLSPAVDTKRDAVVKSIRRNYPGRVTFADDGLRARP
ncbi:MAG TPA: MBL fold metallo-hydrolase [Steroidobacteraceae bacterium]|jgi:ribonuclease BN (tRNA processing enzyme)|nr:MBL fold metallo-hydrolase [Steroidobacteraceae bacterium]